MNVLGWSRVLSVEDRCNPSRGLNDHDAPDNRDHAPSFHPGPGARHVPPALGPGKDVVRGGIKGQSAPAIPTAAASLLADSLSSMYHSHAERENG